MAYREPPFAPAVDRLPFIFPSTPPLFPYLQVHLHHHRKTFRSKTFSAVSRFRHKVSLKTNLTPVVGRPEEKKSVAPAPSPVKLRRRVLFIKFTPNEAPNPQRDPGTCNHLILIFTRHSANYAPRFPLKT